MKEVKVTWKAFGDRPEIERFISSVEFKLPVSDKTDFAICEEIYKQTNLYQGTWWKLLIEPLLSATRTHTSLSVGDEVEIDGRGYVCANMGFERIPSELCPACELINPFCICEKEVAV